MEEDKVLFILVNVGSLRIQPFLILQTHQKLERQTLEFLLQYILSFFPFLTFSYPIKLSFKIIKTSY